MFSTFLVLVAGVAWPLCIELFLGPAPRVLLLLGATPNAFTAISRWGDGWPKRARPAAKTQFATAGAKIS